MKISVIVSTYNKPTYLKLVLEALKEQQDPGDFEVVIADDGSGMETKAMIDAMRKDFPVVLKHAWQEDKGFRLAASRNNALRKASGSYIIFLDGDCIPRRDFVAKHRRLAEPGFFVTGTRVLLSKEFSYKIESKLESLDSESSPQLFKHYLNKEINKISSLFPNPFYLRKLSKNNWKKLRGCNFALWMKDLERVNGFDEEFIGWGFEDSDLAVRLINSGIKRKSGNFLVTVFHLYHPEKKSKQEGSGWLKLMERIKNKQEICQSGLDKK